MEKLDIDIKNIDKIVISHEHSDHNGGLKSLPVFINNCELYRLIEQIPCEKMHYMSSEYSRQIAEGVFTTGRLTGSVDEQSLVLKGKKGWYVLVGCSHPGIEKILQAAQHIGNIIGIVGGFHGFNNFQLLENLGFICPCHCTAYKEKLKKTFPDKITKCGVGKSINLDIS